MSQPGVHPPLVPSVRLLHAQDRKSISARKPLKTGRAGARSDESRAGRTLRTHCSSWQYHDTVAEVPRLDARPDGGGA